MPTKVTVFLSLLILWAGVAGSTVLFTYTRNISRDSATSDLDRFCDRKKTETMQQIMGGSTVLTGLTQGVTRAQQNARVPQSVNDAAWLADAAQLATSADWNVVNLSHLSLFYTQVQAAAWCTAENTTRRPPGSAEIGHVSPRDTAMLVTSSYPNISNHGIDYYLAQAPALTVDMAEERKNLTISPAFWNAQHTNRYMLIVIPIFESNNGTFSGGVSGVYRDDVMILEKESSPGVYFSLTINGSILVMDADFPRSDISIAFPFVVANGNFNFSCGTKYSPPVTPIVILVMGIMLSMLIPLMSLVYMRQLRLVNIENMARMAAEKGAAAARIGEAAAKEATRVKSAFFCTISHEIRTPLNGIRGNTDFLLETELTEEQASFAHTINESTCLLTTIVNDVLDFEQIEAGKMRKEIMATDVTGILRQLQFAFASTIQENSIDFETLCADDLRVMTDPSRLRQILNNLVSNALKFTRNGKVTVRASIQGPTSDSIPRKTVFGCRTSSGPRIAFEVIDTGIGVSSQQELFAPFTQADSSTSRRFGGTGLGLSISKRLVALLDGDIGVDSTLGEGSRFHFWIPFIAAPPITTLLRPSRHGSMRRRTSATPSFTQAQASQHRGSTTTPRNVSSAPAMTFTPPATPAPDTTSFFPPQPSSTTPPLPAPPSPKPRPVFVNIPIRDPESLLLRNTPALTPTTPPARLSVHRILVVDDNGVNRKVAERTLLKLGYSSVSVEDGQKAVDTIEGTQPGLPKGYFAAVLMDISMPVLDGLAATKAIRAKGHTLPIIAVTANVLEMEGERCLAAGMDGYMPKPIDRSKLRDMLASLLPSDDDASTA
ncbi:hypothetical protein HKX48_002834 [Thoreauomyces humboldtii]|nr:hypothetical protein HKX48_002834 [Thoreauomyces humboldtii]